MADLVVKLIQEKCDNPYDDVDKYNLAYVETMYLQRYQNARKLLSFV